MSRQETIDLRAIDGKDAFKRALGGQVLPKGNIRPRHTPGEMNKTEAKMNFELDLLQRDGQIIAYYFESVKLKLAKRTWYTPDFFIIWKDGTLEMRETKGFWEDHSRAKFKMAAEKFRQFKFTAYKPLKGGQWDVEVIVP